MEGLPVTVYTDKEKYKQVQHYNDYFLDIVKVEALWVAVIDLDEFLYARDPYTDIPSVLREVPQNIPQLLLRWKNFGSSGHIKQPKSIRNNFVMRKSFDQPVKDQEGTLLEDYTKGIARTVDLIKFDVHKHNVGPKQSVIWPNKVTETDLLTALIHINHYPIQSYNWYKKIKCTRGDVNDARHNNTRDDEYFNKRDFNDVEDTELTKSIHHEYSPKVSLDSIRKEFTRITPKQWQGENVEQELIHKYLLPGDIVFELGGNIGRSSIVACQVAGVNGSLVVSESDEKNREELAQNMRGSLCNFRIVPAFSDTPLYQKGWVTQGEVLGSATQDTPGDGFNRIKTLPYRELSSYSPTVLVIDCEGCFDDILHKADIDLSNVHTIIIENDGSEEQNKRIKDTLLKDFTSVECGGPDNNNCFWQVLQRRKKTIM